MSTDEPVSDRLSPDCHRIRQELSSLLYGELAPDTRAALERHLGGCSACRDELAALRDTQRLLGRWETPPSNEDPRQIARAIAAAARTHAPRPARRAPLLRFSALLAGAAAALLFSLSLLHANASYEGGRFELSFGLPGSAPVAPALAPDWRAEVDATVAEQVAQAVASTTAGLEQDREELLRRCSLMTKQELLRLSQAVDYALARSQESWDIRLTTLGREAARADLETRRVLTEFASYLPVSQNH